MQSRLPLSQLYAQSKTLARVRAQTDTSSSSLYPSTQSVAPAPIAAASSCPTCLRPWPSVNRPNAPRRFDLQTRYDHGDGYEAADTPSYVAPNYFRLLAQASSVPGSRAPTRPSSPTRLDFSESASSTRSATPDAPAEPPEPLQQGVQVEGYYSRFFYEIKQLGRGARGTVFLCQHVLNGNRLGKYAIKKIPVGDHAESLLKSLNEVHLMESLHHPHLIHYQHAWIESCQSSPFAPRVPTLHVLMMAANGGSLADWVSARSGDAANQSPRPSNNPPSSGAAASPSCDSDGLRRDALPNSSNPIGIGRTASPAPGREKVERLKAALRQRRAKRQAQAQAGAGAGAGAGGLGSGPGGVGVHLLRQDEIYSLVHDMASGLGFLHDRGVLHLDIKPANVLLHWDEDSLIPRAMLSDFGSSLLLHDNWTRQRTGHTGTMEYMAPETLATDPVTGKLCELSSKADIWSLGACRWPVCNKVIWIGTH